MLYKPSCITILFFYINMNFLFIDVTLNRPILGAKLKTLKKSRSLPGCVKGTTSASLEILCMCVVGGGVWYILTRREFHSYSAEYENL